jgi:hypothetical protein
MRVCGKIIRCKAMESSLGLMGGLMLAISIMIKNMEKEYLHGVTDAYMKEISSTAFKMAEADIQIEMASKGWEYGKEESLFSDNIKLEYSLKIVITVDFLIVEVDDIFF